MFPMYNRSLRCRKKRITKKIIKMHQQTLLKELNNNEDAYRRKTEEKTNFQTLSHVSLHPEWKTKAAVPTTIDNWLKRIFESLASFFITFEVN